MRGVLITIEGMEGSGKTTRCRMLAERLRAGGYAVRETSERDGTAPSVAVRMLFETAGAAPTPRRNS